MRSADIQRQIILTLGRGTHGLDQAQIAASVDQAPFRVRAELKVLAHQELVEESGTLWQLTPRGHQHP